MVTKNNIRNQILEIRNQMPEEERLAKSLAIGEQIKNLKQYNKVESIFIYVSIGSEVNTIDMIQDFLREGKRVAVPKVNGRHMDFYEIRSLTELHQGYFGILEPEEKYPITDALALMIMPGVAFDYELNRIGYGKGFYDGYLDRNPMEHTLAIAYECQMIERIPTESHDKKPDMILTERNIYK